MSLGTEGNVNILHKRIGDILDFKNQVLYKRFTPEPDKKGLKKDHYYMRGFCWPWLLPEVAI